MATLANSEWEVDEGVLGMMRETEKQWQVRKRSIHLPEKDAFTDVKDPGGRTRL